jgi:hypothetical protein
VALFRQHLDEAIALYRETLAQDDAYIPSAVNVGCALLLRGSQAEKHGLNADVSEAVTALLRALERVPHAPETPTILNTLGVALWYAGRPDDAKIHLTRARTLAPSYAAPLFNLAHIAHMEGRQADAHRYQQAYEQMASGPSAGVSTSGPRLEQAMGVTIGQLMAQVPQHWGKPTQSTFQLDQKTFVVATYPTGMMTLVRDGEVLMMLVRKGSQDRSARGVAIGSEAREVLSRYGPPSRRLETTHGENWAYDAARIAFQLRDGRVVSWLLF